MILSTLENLCQTGIPKKEVEIALMSIEFADREVKRANGPFSLALMRRCYRGWMNEKSPFEILQDREIFKQIKEKIQNDDNYITLIGEVTEIDSESSYNAMLSIKCEELKQYNLNADDECKYSVFSSSNVNIGVGDTIVYKTIPNRFDYMEFLPIVAIDKNDETILDFEEGKENSRINHIQDVKVSRK